MPSIRHLFIVMTLFSTSLIHAGEDLNNLPARHAKCWMAHDAGAMADLYWNDADHVSSPGVYTSGKKLIHSRYASAFLRQRLKNSDHQVLETKVRKLSDDVGLIDVLWKMTGLVDEAGKPAKDIQGRYCMIALKKNGVWKIAALRAMVADNAYQAGIQRREERNENAGPKAAANDAAGVAALKDLPGRLRDLWAAKDANGLASLFATDADHISSQGTLTSGRDALRTRYADWFSRERLKNTKHKHVRTSIRQLSDHVAIVDSLWVLTGATDDAGEPIEKIYGRSTMVANQVEGKWFISALRAMIPDNAFRAGIEEGD